MLAMETEVRLVGADCVPLLLVFGPFVVVRLGWW